MDDLNKLAEIGSLMDLEPDAESSCPDFSPRRSPSAPSSKEKAPFISHAVLPNGKRITLLKSLLTSACERNCFYCPFRAGRDTRRATFKPGEMAAMFIDLRQAGIVEGIFLSSGIAGGSVRTQDGMIATAEILRQKLRYTGYLHLKLMPGSEKDQIVRAMQLADRVSVNLEAPNTERLKKLAPHKAFLDELLQPLKWVQEIRRSRPPREGWNGRWPSMTTQFVVGAAGESDLELLQTTAHLHQQLGLSRVYFSAFRPITDTPLENLPAESPLREYRLYQASFLLRDYGFLLEDLPFTEEGGLPRGKDPKLAWAEANLEEQPVDVNRAGRGELLRVPGIGPKGAQAILSTRVRNPLKSLSDLRRIGINPQRAAPFILIGGRRPTLQMSFW